MTDKTSPQVCEWPDLVPGRIWYPCYWQPGTQFAAPPDTICVHSGSKSEDVAGYLHRMPDKRKVATHFAWSKAHRCIVQQLSLRTRGWGTGSATVGGVNGNNHCLHIELSGPHAQNPRREVEQEDFCRLVADLRVCLPSIRYWTRHSDVDSRKRDPGPGFNPDEWGMGELIWVGG